MSQNPYQTPADYGPNYGPDYGRSAAMATEDARASFIRKTYLHLLGAILACVAIDALILYFFDAQLQQIVPMVTGGFSWLLVLGAFMFVSYVADRWAHSNVSQSQQYLGLGLYVVAEALILIPLLYIAEHYAGTDVIQSAGLVTAVVFGGLTLTVFVTKADFSFLRWAIVAGSVIALGLIVVAIIAGFSLGFWFSAAMVVLAMGIILYNTSNVLHHYSTHQHVAASLSLFASIALLFWYVLQIFMSFRE
ncbi:Bax inhibitor-1 family protein [Mariniblastus sp.]|nr:Bax inhibitor-1 family protein [Mariniblastus sp.]